MRQMQHFMILLGCISGMVFLAMPVSASKLSCLEKCFLEHPLWRHPLCAKTSSFFIQGPKCYELYNQCLARCSASTEELKRQYLGPHKQLEDEWKQSEVCSSAIERIPMAQLPAKTPIEPEWAGHCQCLNGRLIEAPCGHQRISCQEACNTGKAF